MTDWRHLTLMLVGALIAMTAFTLFVGIADYDYKFAIDTVDDSPPNRVADIQPYDGLTDRQQEIFERAKAGETVRFEDENPMPEVVRYQGEYYVAEAPRYIDWTDQRTFGPTLLFFLGAAIAIHAARLDLRTSATV